MDNKPFDFKADKIKHFITYEMKLMKKMKESFNYLFEKYEAIGNFMDLTNKVVAIDLEKQIKWAEGKNYDWCAIKKDNVKLIIRKYQMHFTVYATLLTEDKMGDHIFRRSSIAAFTFEVDRDMLPDEEKDNHWENQFFEFNNHLLGLIEAVAKDDVHGLWNDYSFPRPKYVKIKNIFEGESISSYDLLIFCAEELSTTHLQMFAENETFDEVKKSAHRIGEDFDHQYTLTGVSTELKDGYYHGVGFQVTDKRNGEKTFKDVYSLTYWYLDNLFRKEEEPKE